MELGRLPRIDLYCVLNVRAGVTEVASQLSQGQTSLQSNAEVATPKKHIEVAQLSARCLVRPSAVLLCGRTRTVSTETARHFVSLPAVLFNTFGTLLTYVRE